MPQYEWAAKILLFANELAFCARPMSAINIVPFVAQPPFHPWSFPFHSGLGIAGAVAEVQFHVLRELDTPWSGGNEAFVRALTIDCMMETGREAYKNKGNAYFAALKEFEGGHLAPFFRPEFHEVRQKDQRRGLHDGALLIDRFVGGRPRRQGILHDRSSRSWHAGRAHLRRHPAWQRRQSHMSETDAEKFPTPEPSITELEVAYAADAAANGWGDRIATTTSSGLRTASASILALPMRLPHRAAPVPCTWALPLSGLAAATKSSSPTPTGSPRQRPSSTSAPRRSSSISCPTAGASIQMPTSSATSRQRPEAIIATHIYGNLCDMDRLLDIGRRHGIPVIEDAAEAIGSEWHGRRAGSMGTFGTFSFHGTKTLTTGEGGMFVTSDDALFEKVLTLKQSRPRPQPEKAVLAG